MRQSENLSEAPIRKFTGFHNPEYKKKCTVHIGTILSLRNLVGVQEETALFLFLFTPYSNWPNTWSMKT